MHKIDGPGATADNEFTEGNPNVGIPATTVTDDWLNTVQRELVNVVQAAGIDLDKSDDAQVLAAIDARIPSKVPFATAAEIEAGVANDRAATPAGLAALVSPGTSGYAKLAGGVLIQWMSVAMSGATTSFTWPIAFSAQPWSVVATDNANSFVIFALGATASATAASVWSRNVETGAEQSATLISIIGVGPY